MLGRRFYNRLEKLERQAQRQAKLDGGGRRLPPALDRPRTPRAPPYT